MNNGCEDLCGVFSILVFSLTITFCFGVMLYCIFRIIKNCSSSRSYSDSPKWTHRCDIPVTYSQPQYNYQDNGQSNWYGNNSNMARQHMEFDQIKRYPNDTQKQEQKKEIRKIEKSELPANQYDFISIKKDKVGIERTINITNSEGSKTVRRESISSYLKDANTDLVLYGRLA